MNLQNTYLFKQQALQYASTFDACCCLDSNNYKDQYAQYDCLIAFGIDKQITVQSDSAFSSLKSFIEIHKDWMFGMFSYELKAETDGLKTDKIDQLNFPDLFFFVPKYLIALQGDEVKVIIGDEQLLKQIEAVELKDENATNVVSISQKISKANYIETVKRLQQHIARGDIYEVNFCQEFFSTNTHINPLQVYQALNGVSPTPFSGFFKIFDKYILSATPERFLAKRGNKLISQPIKGTAKRSENLIEDERIKSALKNDVKEQAENVMIVDLVRNDLTKSAVKGSVKVDELFGIYSFPQVHQMISTISCELNSEIHFVDAIKNAFPMGSMTGAPKIKAMQLIDQYEESKRGIYSGSFGCISPSGDFDFNVIIRSILYNETNKYLSFQVGGAITFVADAEKEYEECLLKASAIMKVLGN
ncbi:MAG: anthranilate synthase component I family protein [Flavobacterium sp.]|nr:MAG: anthranilate synthase component I family protein [Flavobacterium sp.]